MTIFCQYFTDNYFTDCTLVPHN